MRHPRPALVPFAAVLGAALVLAAALPAAARELTVTFTPDHATWDEEVRVTVSGTVVTSCGPEIVHLDLDPTATTYSSYSLDLTESPCGVLGPSSAHPFSVSATLPPLVPRDYVIEVRDVPEGGTVQRDLTVLDVSPVPLEVPGAVRSGESSELVLRGWGSCPAAEVELVSGVLEGDYSTYCPILPPAPEIFALPVDVPPLPAGLYPIHLLDHDHEVAGHPTLIRGTLRVQQATACQPSPTALCLQDGRFQVEVAWKDFQGHTGHGRALPLPDREDSGLFWFFDPRNVELTVKVLDGCAINDRYWVFVASGSTVEYRITVTDTQEDRSHEYANGLGETPRLLPDTAAFATCP